MEKNRIVLNCLLWIVLCIPHNLEARDAGNKVRRIANSYVGIHEKGGNNAGFTSYIFQRKMKAVGWRPGYAWCSFFVMLVLEEGNVPNTINGWAPTSFNEDEPIFVNNKFVAKPDPTKVQVMSLCYNKFKKKRNRGIGHTGIVQEFGQYSFSTTEGNTNASGTRDSRTGDSVCSKRRPYSANTLISEW